MNVEDYPHFYLRSWVELMRSMYQDPTIVDLEFNNETGVYEPKQAEQ